MAREINLVPDIKNEMIKVLKLRNFIFFICIIVAIASVATTAVFGSIMGGQQLAIDGKKGTITNLSNKLTSFTDLTDYLTIKDQLSGLSTISDNQKVFSRTFNILSALLPHGADTIKISELSVNLSDDNPILSFDAQANSGTPPYIDYNVLDAFKKSMQYMRYDHGSYVDQDGKEIPAYCMIESGADGSILRDTVGGRGYYALWTIHADGCNPFREGHAAYAGTTETASDPAASGSETGSGSGTTSAPTVSAEVANDYVDKIKAAGYVLEKLTDYGLYLDDYNLREYPDGEVIRIWRTPQFSDWYKGRSTNLPLSSFNDPSLAVTDTTGDGSGSTTGDGTSGSGSGSGTSGTTTTGGKVPSIDLNGNIKNVAHFESKCLTYSGDASENRDNPKWSESNTCNLVPEGVDGIRITESSNGRNSEEDLVLRFSAILTLSPEVYKFNNYHMLALAPTGRYNVTDSYVQIQAMFGERARDCADDDVTCRTTGNTSTNNSSNNNNNRNNNTGNN